MKKKVAFFADILIKDFDGASRTMFQILERIPKRDYEFLFITGKGPAHDFTFEVQEVTNVKIPFNKSYSMALPVMDYFSLKKKLDNFSPDLIHIASPSLLGNFALDYAESRGLPVITIYHTHFISYVSYYLRKAPIITGLAEKVVINGQKKFYNRCDLILVPTELIKKELIGYGFDESKLVLWQRGLDHAVFNTSKKLERFSYRMFDNNHPVLLFASRMVWEKNLHILPKLYDHFESNEIDVNFLMVGDGVAKPELQRRMPKALFTGKVDHDTLSTYYSSSDVFVFPSISETYGNVVVEAMASGLPCVVGNGGGSSSFIRQGINGFKCQPEDISDFIQKIKILLKSNSIRSNIISAGLKYIQPLEWNKLVQHYFGYIDHLTHNSYQYA